MGTQPGSGTSLSRRELMKRGMRASAYAAPVVLTSVAALPAAAQVSRPTATPTLLLNGMTALSVPLGSTFTVTGTGYPANTTVYLVLLNTTTNTFSFIAVMSDGTGSISGMFNTTTTPVTRTGGTGTYAVISTLTMPTMTSFTGQLVRDPLTLTTPTICNQSVPFTQDFVLTMAAPNTTYDVRYLPNNLTPGMCGVNFIPAGTLTTDAAGVGATTFMVSLNPSTVTSVQVVALVPGFDGPPMGGMCAPSNPLNPVNQPPLISNVVTTLACTNNNMNLPTPQLIALVVQEQIAPFNNIVDVGLFNATPNTTYTITIQPNGTGTPITLGTITTNASGNNTVIFTTPTSGVTATSFVVNALLGGTTAFTFTVSGAQLINARVVPAANVSSAMDALAIHGQGYSVH